MESSSSSSDDDFVLNNQQIPLLHRSSTSSDSDNELIDQLVRRRRNPRVFRQRPDNFTMWSEQEFFIRFRLQKATVMSLLNEIEVHLLVDANRNHAVSPRNQLLLALRFYATGNMLIAVGDFSGVHKATACRIIKRVTTAIASLAATYISMPRNDQEMRNTQMEFHRIARFPKIIGAIDCTHVKNTITRYYFRNRKGYFSLNIQAIADSTLRILDVVARWPGSTHDQTIFNNSRIHARVEAGEFNNCIILGDSGYGLTKYLITPLLHPTTRGEQLFNEAQIRSRNPVERLFGVWKRRFPVLSLGIRLSIDTTQAVVIACAVLQNIAIDRNEDQPPDDPNVVVPAFEPIEAHNIDNINEVQTVQIDFRQTFIAYFSEFN
ncbi:hypothetical protein RN001_005054 [Aquatica leii]|uniref:Putative nuclease HARBI1 n=1 Tax=Aquatica leii TaxID=1421715 RepID=A0AAN7Q6C0_9COLE|nr:hypothetical protein RN001_005054 [Aquatica leii]